MLLVEGLKDFGRDLINTKLLILKVTYFTLLAGIVILWPQFTIHQQALGLTPYQTGIIGAISSVLTVFLPFLSGFIGDKLGNYKVFMSTVTALSAVPVFLLAWIPSARVEVLLQSISANDTTTAANVTTNITDVTNTATTTTTSLNITSQEVDPDQLVVTFWLYLAARVSFGILQGAGFLLFEASVMANMQHSGINYGYQRAWGTLAAIVSSFLGGYIVDATGGFSVIFYVSCGLQILTCVLMLGVQMDFKVPSTSLTKGILKYFLNLEVILFFGAMLSAGVFIGYIETFMYRYLSGLGASSVLIGLTVTVGAPFELIFTLITAYFVKRIGHAPLITLGLLAYAVRMAGYSFLVDPWWALPLEILDSVANGLMFTTAIMYCTVLFSMATIASFQGVFSATYFGIGKLLGTLIGSEIRERQGDKITFQIWSGVALLCAVTYALCYGLLKRHRIGTLSMEPHENSWQTKLKPKQSQGIDNKAWDGNE